MDLQALTVGVAVLSMSAWLDQTRTSVTTEKSGGAGSGSAGSLAARKLAIVNGPGEHSRAQVLLKTTCSRSKIIAICFFLHGLKMVQSINTDLVAFSNRGRRHPRRGRGDRRKKTGHLISPDPFHKAALLAHLIWIAEHHSSAEKRHIAWPVFFF